MIPLKYLVVGVADYFLIMIYKAFADRGGKRDKFYFRIEVCKDAVKPFELLGIFGEYVWYILITATLMQIVDQHIELPVEYRLFFCSKLYCCCYFIARYLPERMVVPFYKIAIDNLLFPCFK